MENRSEKINRTLQELKIQYPNVKLILDEANDLIVYGDDDSLWDIFEKGVDYYSSIEFNADKNDAPYLRIIP